MICRWVLGPNAPNPNGRAVYYPADNNADPGEAFNINYQGTGDGNDYVSGNAALDSVTVAGLQIPNVPLDVATDVGSVVTSAPYDGIIGFGFQGQNSIRPDQSQTFMELAVPNLDQPIFALDLYPDGSGTIELGATDDTAYSGDLMSIPIDGSTSSWIVDGVTFDFGNGFSMPMSFGTFSRAVHYTPMDLS